MRPIRSAAGRLDRLAGSGGSDSEDEELDKEGLYDPWPSPVNCVGFLIQFLFFLYF